MILLCLIDDTFAFEVATRLSCMTEWIQVADLVGRDRETAWCSGREDYEDQADHSVPIILPT